MRGTTALVFPATKNGNETYTRMMIVDNHTRRIKQTSHLRRQRPVAVGELAKPPGSGRSRPLRRLRRGIRRTADGPTCYLPESVKLEWKRDQLTLDVLMQDVKVNQFDSSRSAALFVEPVLPGHERRNLAELNRARPEGSAKHGETNLASAGARERSKARAADRGPG